MIGYYIIDLDHQFTTPGWILQALLNRFTINEIWRMLAQRLPPCPKQWEGGSSGKICGQIIFPKAEQKAVSTKKLLAPSKHKTPFFFGGGKFRPALLWYAKGAFWYCQNIWTLWEAQSGNFILNQLQHLTSFYFQEGEHGCEHQRIFWLSVYIGLSTITYCGWSLEPAQIMTGWFCAETCCMVDAFNFWHVASLQLSVGMVLSFQLYSFQLRWDVNEIFCIWCFVEVWRSYHH